LGNKPKVNNPFYSWCRYWGTNLIGTKRKTLISRSGNRYLWFCIQKIPWNWSFDENEIYPYITEGIERIFYPWM
jgi:hypothetical protein